MGIVGEPPTPATLFITAIAILSLGIIDFLKPTMCFGAGFLAVISFFILFNYIFTHKEKPYMTKIKVTESDGTEHYEDIKMPGGATINSLLFGLGIMGLSIMEYIYPWTRIGGIIFIIFGTYACASCVFVLIDIYLNKGDVIK